MTKNNNLKKGIFLIICSALLVTAGQFFWKISVDGLWLALIGFVLYGVGALCMILAFRFGELSVLHPMLSVSYVLSIVIGYFVLNEAVTAGKILGVACVCVGMVFLGLASKDSAKKKEGTANE